jgi:hypothetical protein
MCPCMPSDFTRFFNREDVCVLVCQMISLDFEVNSLQMVFLYVQ